MKDYNKALAYEILVKEEYAFSKDKIQSSKYILDIGAHKGYFCQYCLQQNPEVVIDAREPLETPISEIINHSNIHWHNQAVGPKDGSLDLFVYSEKTMQSSAFTNTFLNTSQQHKTVNMISFSSILQQKIGFFDLVKIDIEGMEYDILDSLGTSDRDKIKSLIVEYHILSPNRRDRHNQLEDKLRQIFSIFQVIPSPYSNTIGYRFASK